MRVALKGVFAACIAVVISVSLFGCSPNPQPGDNSAIKGSKGTIVGVVRDAQKGTRLPQVTVSTTHGLAQTDKYGKYTLCLPYGKYSIDILANGYKKHSRVYTVNKPYVMLKTVYLLSDVGGLNPAPSPSPAPSPPPSQTTDVYETNMVELVNTERTQRGLTALIADDRLVSIARAHSQDMISGGFFSHTSPISGTPWDRLKNGGVLYRFAGENIAGNQSVSAAHTSLMNSDGHRANILNPNFTSIGIGIRLGGTYGMYITQLFIGN